MVFNNSILAGSSTQEEDVYEIGNSLLFNDDDSPYLQDPNSNAGDSRKKFTFSGWFKLCNLGINRYVYAYRYDDNNNAQFYFNTSDQIELFDKTGGSTQMQLKTNRVFRDVGSWYHIVIIWDTTQSTASDRTQLYVNGQRETSFATATYPSLNADSGGANRTASNMRIGTYAVSGSYFDGFMSELHYFDNEAFNPSSFGKTNSKGIWVPIEYEGADSTYGSNGFYFQFANSGTLGANTKGKGNYSSSGLSATNQAPDTPTNNFTNMNILDNYPHQGVFSKGNLQIVSFQSSYHSHTSTMGLKRGKWYAEIKWTAQGSSPSGYYSNTFFGIVGSVDTTSSIGVGTRSDSYCYIGTTVGSGEDGGKKRNNATSSAYGADYHVNDIIGIALDLDNNKIYWSKNGTFQNSGDPTSGSTGTGSAFDLTTPSSGFYYFAVSDQHGDSSSTWQLNFGSVPPYTISSGNADGNGYGNFEYAVPSGYYSVCTKNISEFG